MTRAERAKPEILKASRKRRIAAGAGVSVQEVNQLLNQFEQTQKMMKMVAKGGVAEDDARDARDAPRTLIPASPQGPVPDGAGRRARPGKPGDIAL